MKPELIQIISNNVDFKSLKFQTDFSTIKVGDHVIGDPDIFGVSLSIALLGVREVTQYEFCKWDNSWYDKSDGSPISRSLKPFCEHGSKLVGFITEEQLQALVTPEIQDEYVYELSSFGIYKSPYFKVVDDNGNPIDYSEEINKLSPVFKTRALEFIEDKLDELEILLRKTEDTLLKTKNKINILKNIVTSHQ